MFFSIAIYLPDALLFPTSPITSLLSKLSSSMTLKLEGPGLQVELTVLGKICVAGRKESYLQSYIKNHDLSNYSIEKNTWEKNIVMADTKMCKDYLFQQAIPRSPWSKPTQESSLLLAFQIL